MGTLKISHNAENVKRGPFGLFQHLICCKISTKIEGAFKKFSQKSQRRKKLK